MNLWSSYMTEYDLCYCFSSTGELQKIRVGYPRQPKIRFSGDSNDSDEGIFFIKPFSDIHEFLTGNVKELQIPTSGRISPEVSCVAYCETHKTFGQITLQLDFYQCSWGKIGAGNKRLDCAYGKPPKGIESWPVPSLQCLGEICFNFILAPETKLSYSVNGSPVRQMTGKMIRNMKFLWDWTMGNGDLSIPRLFAFGDSTKALLTYRSIPGLYRAVCSAPSGFQFPLFQSYKDFLSKKSDLNKQGSTLKEILKHRP